MKRNRLHTVAIDSLLQRLFITCLLSCIVEDARALHTYTPHNLRKQRIRGSVVGPFSHVAFLLSCVVPSEFKQLVVPAHKETLHQSQKRQLQHPSQARGLTTIQHTSASLEVASLKRSWIRHTRDWHIRGDVGQGSMANSVARVAETPGYSVGHGFKARLSVHFPMSPFS